MATLEYGVSGPQVKTLQALINKALKTTRVPENGEFDETTAAGLAELQGKLGIQPSGKADAATLEAIKNALVPRTAIVWKGQTFYLTKEEYADLKAKVTVKAQSPVDRYLSMAKEVKSLWDAHDKVRKDNWFWSNAVDVATGAKFPPKSLIDGAVSAASTLSSGVKSGKLKIEHVDAASTKIRQAFAAMDQYREETFGGSEELVRILETYRDGCVLILEISAAVATGGSSWQIQVAASAALGGYKAMLKEIEKAPHASQQTIGTAVANIFLGAAIDGGAALIMKGGGKGLEKFADKMAAEAAKKVAGEGCKKAGQKAMEAFVLKAIQGGSKAAAEEAVKGVAKSMTPDSKVTSDQIIEDVAVKFVAGALLQNLDGKITGFGKNVSKHVDPKKFKGLGNVDMDKAMSEGGKKALEEGFTRAVPKAVEGANGDPNKVEGLLTKEIENDPQVQKWFKDYAAKKEKEKAKSK